MWKSANFLCDLDTFASNLHVEPPGIRSSTSCQPWRPPVSWRCAPWGHGDWITGDVGISMSSPEAPVIRLPEEASRRHVPGRWQGMVTTLWSTGGHKDWLKMIYWLISPQKWGGWMLETIDILWYFVCLFCFPTDSHHVWAKTTWTPMESLVVDQIHLGFPRWNWQRQGSEVPVFEVGAEVWMDGWWPCFDWCFNTRAPQNLVVYTFSQFP